MTYIRVSFEFIMILSIIIITIVLYMNTLFSYRCDDYYETFEDTRREATIPTEPVKTKIDLVEDSLFKDVVIYNNDEINYKLGIGKLGLEKCIKACKGRCIEFGITGIAYCYPKDDTAVKQAYKDAITESTKAEPNKVDKRIA